MEQTTQQNQAPESAKQMAYRLMKDGLRCYCVSRRWYVLWVPWKQKVISIGDTQKAKRLLGLTDAKFVGDLFYHCMLDREILEVPDRIVRQFPMPVPAPGDRHPSDKDMMKWAKTVLVEMNK